MSAAELTLGASVFLACAVEAVEALTIVLAVGTTRSWSSALAGVASALTVLAVSVAVLGDALQQLPIGLLRLLIGGLLLIFGLQWLIKAIRRAAGVISRHDENEVFTRETDAAQAASTQTGTVDGYALAIAFKGTLLEGLEVIFIVLGFGSNQHHIAFAAACATAAVLVVVTLGIALRAPLARVPENTMKFAVGVMVSSFGIFWGAEGARASWPGGEAALAAIAPALAVAAVAMVTVLRRRPEPARPWRQRETSLRVDDGPRLPPPLGAIWRFFVGDDWRTAGGVVVALALSALLASAGIPAWWPTPLVALGLMVALPRVPG
jgi:uncharacterized membrane protein